MEYSNFEHSFRLSLTSARILGMSHHAWLLMFCLFVCFILCACVCASVCCSSWVEVREQLYGAILSFHSGFCGLNSGCQDGNKYFYSPRHLSSLVVFLKGSCNSSVEEKQNKTDFRRYHEHRGSFGCAPVTQPYKELSRVWY